MLSGLSYWLLPSLSDLYNHSKARYHSTASYDLNHQLPQNERNIVTTYLEIRISRDVWDSKRILFKYITENSVNCFLFTAFTCFSWNLPIPLLNDCSVHHLLWIRLNHMTSPLSAPAFDIPTLKIDEFLTEWFAHSIYTITKIFVVFQVHIESCEDGNCEL